MPQGRYFKWNPLPGLSGPWYIDALHDDFEGFRIILRSGSFAKPLLRLLFEAPLLYQAIQESFCLAKPDEGSDDTSGTHPFFIVADSPLVRGLHQSSLDVYKDMIIEHFAIHTANQCVDVLSVEQPRIDRLCHDSIG